MKVNDIKVVNGGSANIYKLTSDNGEKYILKEFQSKFSGKTILKEINIINFLRSKGLSVPEYVTCLDGKQYFEYNDKTVIIQKFIEGHTQGNYSGNVEQMLESAKYLGIIVNALEDYPYDDMSGCNIEKYTSNEIIDKSITKHEDLIVLAEKDELHGSEIIKDLKDKIDMLNEMKKDGTFKKATNVTIKKSHGDYNVLQFIYNDNGKMKAIIDFVNAGEMPIVWEIARSEVKSKELASLLLDFDNVLGLDLKNSEKYLEKQKEIEIPIEISELIEKRKKAREEKNWSLSDEIREELKLKGYIVKDTKEGMTVEKI